MKTSAYKFTSECRNENLVQAKRNGGRGGLKFFRTGRAGQAGFTLAEVMVSVAITAAVFVSLYAGISSCFGVVQLNRENVRATQILQEKMEVARLYTWGQLIGGYIPDTFTAPYLVGSASSLNYTGSVSVVNAPLTETYAADMRQIHIDLTWSSRGVKHKREMTTFISKYGLQNYLYND
jgi:prepilin-type N-terminal cleavage/methylation domain-containing protein